MRSRIVRYKLSFMRRWVVIVGGCFGLALFTFASGLLFYSYRTNTFNERTSENVHEAQRVLAAIPIWHKKIKTEQMVKVGFITDTHVHPLRLYKSKNPNTPRYLEYKYRKSLQGFVAQMHDFQPDIVIHGGDVIDGTNEENHVGIQGLALVKKELDKITTSLHWVLGNHDLRAVTKEQFLQTLGQEKLNYSYDIGDYRFVFLDGNKDVTLEELLADELVDAQVEEIEDIEDVSEEVETLEETDGDHNMDGSIPQDEIVWLKEQLATDKRVFVFCHYPLFTRTITSADGDPKKSVPNASAMQAIFDEYRVDGVFAGHVEAQMYFQEKLTHYYVMTGTKKSETYPESYYELTITAGKPDTRMFYTSPLDLKQYAMDFETGQQSATIAVSQ